MSSQLTNSESIQLRTTIAQFYENLHPQNLYDIDVYDNYLFTLPPFLYINENNNLVFILAAYHPDNIELNSHDLAELMGYITTTIRLLQIRYSRLD